MRREIRRIHRETRITMLYVTHDQGEALSLAERLAVMRDGHVEQTGSPMDIYRKPANAFVASFLGRANLLAGRVVGGGPAGTVKVETPLGQVVARAESPPGQGEEVVCSIRAESVVLRVSGGGGEGDENVFPVKVMGRTYEGETVEYRVSGAGASELSVLMMGDADANLKPGESAEVAFEAEKVCVMSK